MKNVLSILFLFVTIFFAKGQFSAADSLRGGLSPLRSCYDVKFYDLYLQIDFNQKSIRGLNSIRYKVLQGFNMIQLDLFENMKIDSILHGSQQLDFHRKGNAVFVDFGSMQPAGITDVITVYYHGRPIEAKNPPWDGGFIWRKDEAGNPWLAVSCEGIGASLWWPNKDHLSDEPDSMRIRTIVPPNLMSVSNGQLRSVFKNQYVANYTWVVTYPINNYNVTLNVGNYTHFEDRYISPTDSSQLAMDYYVLPEHLEQAKTQFKQAHEVLATFEKYLGKYPFWKDGYALVETPYLGMEHQSAIAYGNQFKAGYLGHHPEGMPEDFIILHETGHEWWGNSVSCRDHGEMWLHESFCTYMESVFMEEKYGPQAAERYLKFQYNYIENKQPLLGPLNVNFLGNDSDIYYKGAQMLHSLRQCFQNDSLWWASLKGFYQKYKINSVNTQDYIQFVQEFRGQDYGYFFKQYLEETQIPKLEYEVYKKGRKRFIRYRWTNCRPDFKMPIFLINEQHERLALYPNTQEWQSQVISKKMAKNIQFAYALFLLQDLSDQNN